MVHIQHTVQYTQIFFGFFGHQNASDDNSTHTHPHFAFIFVRSLHSIAIALREGQCPRAESLKVPDVMCARGRQNIQIKGQSKRAKAKAKQTVQSSVSFVFFISAQRSTPFHILLVRRSRFRISSRKLYRTTDIGRDRDSTEYITQTLTHSLSFFILSTETENAVFTGKGSKPFSYSRRSAKKSKIK